MDELRNLLTESIGRIHADDERALDGLLQRARRRERVRRAGIIAGAMVVTVAGAFPLWAGFLTPGVPTRQVPADPLAPPEYVACEYQPFSPTVFSRPANAENGSSALAAGLRRAISNPHIEPVPKTGWRLLYLKGDEALFGNGEPPHIIDVAIRRTGDRWQYSGSGGCTVRPWRSAARTAVWTLHPDAPPLTAETREIDVLVKDPACSSGEPIGDRLLPPQVTSTAHVVVVTFFVEPLPRGFYTCQGVPPTRTTLSLDMPLGDRDLLDGSVYPPQPISGEE
jgi:hypothetical protein